MFTVKVCGITRPEDARVAVDAGADAIGMIFVEGTPRCVTTEQARAIVADLPDTVHKVGVFVNATADTICRIADEVGLTVAQLHGDEQPTILSGLTDLHVVRTVRIKPVTTREQFRDYLGSQLLEWLLADGVDRATETPQAFLIDTHDPAHYGGTGRSVPWSVVGSFDGVVVGAVAGPGSSDPVTKYERPLLLAGGLTPDNVQIAIEQARPRGVDVASGVESEPGIKDADKVRTFVSAARDALAELAGDKQRRTTAEDDPDGGSPDEAI